MKFRGKNGADEIMSLLAEGTALEGEITFDHGLRVDGRVKGKVRSEASLLIGPKGRVDAEVHIRRISISGEFRGVIHADERVEIHKDGKVQGEIFTPCLIIEAGAHFDGKCNMNERADKAAEATQSAPLAAEQGKNAAFQP